MAAGLGDPERARTQAPELLVHEMGLQPGMTVADIGAGVGFMLPYLGKAVTPGGHVIAGRHLRRFSECRQAESP
jgi:cyclopropane fatty-acyl-phospholipid synthase-like methyltransferase